MYAIVKTQNGTFYTSAVFAHYYKKSNSEDEYQRYLDSIYNQFYIVLDQDKKRLVKQYVFNRENKYLEPQIHITDIQTDGWSSVKDGYDCIDFLSSIDPLSDFSGIDENLLKQCIQIDLKTLYREYVDVETERDVDNFMFVSGGMHDAFIKNLKQEENYLYVLFDGCWGLKIEMWFSGDVSYSTSSRNPEEFDPYWLGATFKKGNGYFYLIDEEDMDVGEISEDYCWFKARSVRYRLIPQ